MEQPMTHGWPQCIRARESTVNLPGAPQADWMLDEFLRQSVLFFLGEGRSLNINHVAGQQPHYN